jgi:hypothetical protein
MKGKITANPAKRKAKIEPSLVKLHPDSIQPCWGSLGFDALFNGFGIAPTTR